MQAYSLDLRQRVVRAYEQGHDLIATIAERFSAASEPQPACRAITGRRLRLSAGADAAMTVEGAGDTATFNAYVAQVLRPTIRRGDVLVLDNLSAHRASQLETVAAECGARVLWLAPYSPDFSPIELMWSKIKTAVRAAKARTAQELNDALGAALQLVTRTNCFGWFSPCGYQVTRKCN